MLVLLAIVIIIIISFLFNTTEYFYGHRRGLYKYRYGYPTYFKGSYVGLPFWNIPTRTTRNMSYDLRGDVPIRHSYVGPWNISSWVYGEGPIKNKPLWMVS
jgi:hypothetical protein